MALVPWVPGCRLPGGRGPLPQSLATCRQFSQQGIAALERQQWQQAESLLAKAVEACPVDVDARRNYAEALWHRGARKEAISQLEEAAGLATEDATLRVRIAEMQLDCGRLKVARRRAEEALDLDPKSSAAWAVRASTMRAAGDLRKALADYHRALAGAPGDQAILLEIAELYRQLNQPQRALAALHRLADTYAPGEEPQEVLYLQGLAHMALARHGDAVESFSTACLREPPNPEVLYRLAEAQLALGRPAEAATAAHQALSLDPEHGPSRELLARVEVVRAPGRPRQR